MEIALVYMVAGLSSRFGGKIKQFAKVTDKETLIEYSLKQALPSGFTKIIFIVGDKTEKMFKEKFGNNYKGIPVFYAYQTFNPEKRDKPWGSTDALCSARTLIDCPFVVCNGDDLYGKRTFEILIEHLKNNHENATVSYKLGKVVPQQGNVNRGIFKIKNNYVESIEETFNITKDNLKEKELSGDDLCSMNIFALIPETLKLLDESLIKFKEKNENDRKIECGLSTELNNLITKNKIIMRIYPTSEKWFGVTNPGDEIIIREMLNKNINKK